MMDFVPGSEVQMVKYVDSVMAMNRDLLRAGALVIHGLLTPKVLMEAISLTHAALLDGVDGSGVRVFFPGDLDARLLTLVAGGRTAQMVEAALGPSEFLSLKPVVKDGGHAFATPWHQDRAYWGGCVKWSLWIALSPVGIDDGCLRVVRGSHHTEATHAGHHGTDGFANRLPEPHLATVEDVLLNAGDAVLFHDLLWHASRPTAPGHSRVALIPTYRARGATDSSTVWTTAIPLRVT